MRWRKKRTESLSRFSKIPARINRVGVSERVGVSDLRRIRVTCAARTNLLGNVPGEKQIQCKNLMDYGILDYIAGTYNICQRVLGASIVIP